MTQALFLVAYACSGFAGLVYEVGWTRLLTLEMGRSVAASSTVLAAFMGGLALGAALAGRWASTLSVSAALRAYGVLEFAAAALALALPFELRAMSPLFAAVYGDGTNVVAFGVIRLAASLVLLLLPAMVLGATFPVAVRWFAADRTDGVRLAGWLYAANTVGAAVGSALAGFVLIPSVGVFGALVVGAAGSLTASGVAVLLWKRGDVVPADAPPASEPRPRQKGTRRTPARARYESPRPDADPLAQPWLAAGLLAATGAATFIAEVAWTRVFALLVGPSTYAFAATTATFITGLAAGATIGSFLGSKTRQPAIAAGVLVGTAALASVWAANAAGTWLPHRVVLDFAQTPDAPIAGRVVSIALVVLPMTIALGAAFPLSLLVAGGARAVPRTIGAAYALNTIAAVTGSLVAGFLLIPALGLERTLTVASSVLAAGAILVAVLGHVPWSGRAIAAVPVAAMVVALIAGAPWDRDLLASGSYKYASAIAPGLDVETALKSGTIVYYRDGATATVSVKRLTGELSLAIDGKVDASTGGDMLTQKLLAHLPLLLHGDADTICIIGLGSGITVASALTHDVGSVDVLEISPEVVEASRLFARTGSSPLDDPRTRVLVADGRTHLALSSRTYDVIVSEPSNPWMAGVAALFTREFFASARSHLSDGGVICQWVNTYDISAFDLRSVVATFRSVFPHVTMWLAGDGDLLLVGGVDDLQPRLAHLAEPWAANRVTDDLSTVAIASPFGLLSMFVGGDDEAARFASDAPLQNDDRMALEFSAPEALRTVARRANVVALRALMPAESRPVAVARAWERATGEDLSRRAQMLRRAGAYESAYDAARDAIDRAPDNTAALQTLIDSSAALGRQGDAAAYLTAVISRHPDLTAPRVALSKLHAATGELDPAIRVVAEVVEQHPDDALALEQLASIFADVGDADRLGAVVAALAAHQDRAGSAYYVAAHYFLRGQLDEALAAARRALAMDPTLARAQNLVGAILATRGEVTAARTAFEASLVLDAQDPTTYQNLALLELNAGNAAVAARLFAEALSLDPASEPARLGLARARASS